MLHALAAGAAGSSAGPMGEAGDQQLALLLRRPPTAPARFPGEMLGSASGRAYLAFRPALQPALSLGMRSILRDRANRFDLDALVTEARGLFAERPRKFTDLRSALLERYPDADERAMGYAVRTHLPLILVPGEHEWGFPGDADFALAEEWLDRPLETDDRPHALVLRYLAAFGPASAADIQAWSGLAGLAPVLNELRPQLQVFRDERRRELFDLPEAPRPSEDTPVPIRLVADFDNLAAVVEGDVERAGGRSRSDVRDIG